MKKFKIPKRKTDRTKLAFKALLIVLALVFIGVLAQYLFLNESRYELGSSAYLLKSINSTIAKNVNYNSIDGTFEYNNGQSLNGDENIQTGASNISVVINADAKKGLTVTDSVNNIDFSMTPKFSLGVGKKDGNRIVFPLLDYDGWLVYTIQATGVKEDILLNGSSKDNLAFEYKLSLGEGLEAKLEVDGGIGIYGNILLSSDISTGSDSDAELLMLARENAEKDTLLFSIPKPTILKREGATSNALASFSLSDDILSVNVSSLNNASFPISIDPSIYVATAQQFMNGNNETNVDFDVDNKLIEKGMTTGARFDSWDSTMDLNNTFWKQGVAVAGGYIYIVGGVHPNGGVLTYTTPGNDSFVVPEGVTSITVKTWGAGGGGGGGGRSSAGGNGGGGAYSETTLSVTEGETLSVVVGGGGGGGAGSSSAAEGGGGGGYSGILRSGTALIIASGGGGGGGGGYSSGYVGGAGGAGGTTTGITGGASSTANGGTGGTQSSGGTGGSGGGNSGSNGSYLNGGGGGDGRSSAGSDGGASNGGVSGGGNGGARDVTSRYSGGGGGGSGYYGGGGGSGSVSSRGGGGGGSGSSYTTGTGSSRLAGSGTTPGNNSDTDRNNAGVGGNGGSTRNSGSVGTAGIVIISYTSSIEATDAVTWAKFNTSNGQIESTNPGNGTCSGWCTSTSYKLPEPRSSFSLVTYNGFLYAIGGENGSCTAASGKGDGGVCSTVYIAKLGANGEPQLWNPTNTDKSTWTYWYRDSNLTTPRSYTKAVAYNNRLYLLGGLTSSGGSKSAVNTAQIADITATGALGSWSNSSSLPYSVYGHGVQTYNDRIYILGGANSIGGQPINTVYYNKINSNGTLNNWVQTTSMNYSRMTIGGDFTTAWGAYIYVSGGCSAVNANGYCTSVLDNTSLASINADGSVDSWNTNGVVSDYRTGQNIVAWRSYIYQIGGCALQSSSTGTCLSALDTINFGTINQDGDASTVDETVSSGVSPCSGTSPEECNLPGTTYIGNMLTASFITNGYLYVVGGCTNNACSTTTGNVAYTAISSTGRMSRPSTCPTGTFRDSWCVDTTNIISGGIAAASPVVFGGTVYLVGGLSGSGNKNAINRATINDDGSLSSWTSQSMTGLGMTSVSYSYGYARANPSSAGTNPGNLFVFGGCSTSSSAGCTAYSQYVYKCNIQTSGALAGCTTSGQLQIGTLPGDTQPGLGIMSGTVYANYIYLIGGVSPNQVDLTSLRYAKFDDNNNVVAVSGNSWIESPNHMIVGRRRADAFGYNGYIYVVGGYDATAGVLADIEFVKVDVSDGSLGDEDGFQVSAVTINQRWGLSVPVSNSFAYVIGGCAVGASPSNCTSRTDVIQTFQIYNNDSGAPAGYSTSANTYSTSPNRIGASSVILNGYIYVAGGCTSATDCTSATNNVSYAPIDVNGNIGSWSSTSANLPENLAWGELETAGGSLYYIGGEKVAESSCTPTGVSRFEMYNGISGTAITDLYNNAAFPDSPSSTQMLNYTTLSGPSGVGDTFGGRLSAIICAPQTGNYTFWIASDDSSELRLSTNSSPNNVSAIASVNGWTNVNVWDTYSSQQSALVPLVAGQAYYIEANYKEGNGGDHVEIGWQLPSGTYDRPISSSYYMSPIVGSTTSPQSTVYYATPSSGNVTSWGTASNSLPSTRVKFGSTVWNNRIYVVGGQGTGTGCNGSNVCNTVYVSPQLNSGGNISSAWSTASTSFDVPRSGATAVSYANNLYVFGGYDGSNYLSDSQYAQINSSNGQVGNWTFSASLPNPLSDADGFAANGYVYLMGGRSSDSNSAPVTLVAPISANTTIASGNNPTGIGEWYETNQRYSGNRYGSAVSYYDGKAYVIGGAYGSATLSYSSPVIQQTALLSQPQVAKYSIMIDTDSDVFPNYWLLNGIDNSIGAKWRLTYRSMTNTTTYCTSPAMTTWGADTIFGEVSLGTPGIYTPKNGSGVNTNCARFYYFNVTIDSSQAFGYPDDVSRGPTITDLTLQFTSDPSKRLMHGRTFTGGLQQPVDTPIYSY